MPSAPILVVDDEPAVLTTVADILRFEGYVVETATNGAEPLGIVERPQPSLVVLDGWGFARELRARGVKLPILVMTAAHDAQRWAEEVEADAFLAKPFTLADLLTAVEQLYAAGIQ